MIAFCSYTGPYKSLINVMILTTKQYIYATRCTHDQPSFMGAMSKIVEFKKIEKAIAYKLNKMAKHNKNGKFLITNSVITCIVYKLHNARSPL